MRSFMDNNYFQDLLESSGHVSNVTGSMVTGNSMVTTPPFLSVSPSPGPGNVIPFPPFGHCTKTYTKRDMSLALEALRYGGYLLFHNNDSRITFLLALMIKPI